MFLFDCVQYVFFCLRKTRISLFRCTLRSFVSNFMMKSIALRTFELEFTYMLYFYIIIKLELFFHVNSLLLIHFSSKLIFCMDNNFDDCMFFLPFKRINRFDINRKYYRVFKLKLCTHIKHSKHFD